MPAPDLSIDAQIKCIIRELGFRERVYPKWVAGGKMNQAEADLQIATMKAVLETLKAVRDADSVRKCRFCGCTDADCSGCIGRTGQPCHWIDEDVCSACAVRAA